jgi:hypothetical protein
MKTRTKHNGLGTPELLMAESESSLSFVNVLFGVAIAVLAILGGKLDPQSPLSLYLFVIVISSLYSSIFFAVVAGNVARLRRASVIEKPMRYGNAISEYLGIFPIVIVLPLLMWTLTKNSQLTWIAFAIDLLGFAFYVFSGFDMLSRPLPGKSLRLTFMLVFCALLCLQLIAEINVWIVARWLIATIMLLLLLTLVAVHIARGEVS